MLFKKKIGIGLDIGSRKIKLVSLSKSGSSLQIERWAGVPTPFGVVEAGMIYDPERLGEALGRIVRELDITDKTVVSAVSGTQVYTRNLVMPKMKLEELKEAVQYEATTFLPIPAEEAAMDVFPLRDFEEEDGKKVEVFFVAVRRQQVENLKRVCDVAGLKLNVVDIEPLALNRIFRDGRENLTRAFLNIGASRSYFSVFDNNVLVFNRHLAFGAAAFYQEGEAEAAGWDEGLERVDITPGGEQEYLVRDIIVEVSRSIEYYNMQNPDALERVILCGAGSRLKGVDKVLTDNINLQVITADPLEHLTLPDGVDDKSRSELQHDFAVALGLAVRGVS